MGADISRQVQSDTVERFALWMRPLYERIDQKAKACQYLQIDETFIKFIHGRAAGIGQGYFWAIHAPGQSMVFKWIDNRRHENVDELIHGFNGLLQSDAYAAYTNYAAAHPEVTLMACWAHVFRKFREALSDEPTHAHTFTGFLPLIGKAMSFPKKLRLKVSALTGSPFFHARGEELEAPTAHFLNHRQTAWYLND